MLCGNVCLVSTGENFGIKIYLCSAERLVVFVAVACFFHALLVDGDDQCMFTENLLRRFDVNSKQSINGVKYVSYSVSIDCCFFLTTEVFWKRN